GAYDDNALKYAVFDLVGFAHKATTGELLGADGKPVCSQYTQNRMNKACPPCAFDVSKALAAITGDPRNWPPAGKESPSLQQDAQHRPPLIYSVARRVFGRPANQGARLGSRFTSTSAMWRSMKFGGHPPDACSKRLRAEATSPFSRCHSPT